jgi:hypothetical protein
LESCINEKGSYINSNYNNSQCRSHYHATKVTFSLTNKLMETPGPGSYRVPSDFGYYESKLVKNNLLNKIINMTSRNSKVDSNKGKSEYY